MYKLYRFPMSSQRDRTYNKDVNMWDFANASYAEFVCKHKAAICEAIRAYHPASPTTEGRAGSVGVYIDILPSRIKGGARQFVPMLAAANIFEEKYETYPMEMVSTTLLLLFSLHISRLVHRDETTWRLHVQNTQHEGSPRGSDAR